MNHRIIEGYQWVGPGFEGLAREVETLAEACTWAVAALTIVVVACLALLFARELKESRESKSLRFDGRPEWPELTDTNPSGMAGGNYHF